MKLEEIKDEEFYALIAPDGTPQLVSIAPDLETCIAMCELLSKFGMSRPLAILFEENYKVLPIKLSILSNGAAEEGFQKAKQKLK
jgi:hypothetical protein